MTTNDHQVSLVGPDAAWVNPKTSGSRWCLPEPKSAIPDVVSIIMGQLDFILAQY